MNCRSPAHEVYPDKGSEFFLEKKILAVPKRRNSGPEFMEIPPEFFS
jgi:hypothetical protein